MVRWGATTKRSGVVSAAKAYCVLWRLLPDAEGVEDRIATSTEAAPSILTRTLAPEDADGADALAPEEELDAGTEMFKSW